jgi:hypothetical protein
MKEKNDLGLEIKSEKMENRTEHVSGTYSGIQVLQPIHLTKISSSKFL